MSAEIIPMPMRRVRPLRESEQQMLSRALESWEYSMRREARLHEGLGNEDEAHAFNRQADEAQSLLDRISWLRVGS